MRPRLLVLIYKLPRECICFAFSRLSSCTYRCIVQVNSLCNPGSLFSLPVAGGDYGGGATGNPPLYNYTPVPGPTQTNNTYVHTTIAQPRPAVVQTNIHVKPPNYVVMSVITMLFCCFLFGLIGLVVGLQVSDQPVPCLYQSVLFSSIYIHSGEGVPYRIFVWGKVDQCFNEAWQCRVWGYPTGIVLEFSVSDVVDFLQF